MAAFSGFREIIIVSLILFINLCLQIHPISAIVYDCTNTVGNYSQNSKFHSNLNTILTLISSNINTINGFYNGRAGHGVDQVNAIANCRGDIDIESCRDCINDAARNLTSFCPNQKEAIFWLDDLCMFRYSNNSILGIMSLHPSYAFVNVQKASSVNLHSSDLISFAGNLSDAAYNGSLRKFAAMQSNYPRAPTVYGYMECTPDITPRDCEACLNGIANDMSSCCYTNVGGIKVTPSCIYRFEIYPILKATPSPPPSLTPSPPPSLPPSPPPSLLTPPSLPPSPPPSLPPSPPPSSSSTLLPPPPTSSKGDLDCLVS